VSSFSHRNIFLSLNTIVHTSSVFESTIRYLGGLLSAYELSDRQYPALLQKATQLADKMAFAWVGVRTPVILYRYNELPMTLKENAVPFGHINFATNVPAEQTVCYKIYRYMLLKLMISTPIDKHSRSRDSGCFFFG
jgi:hypothetical protein